MAEEIVDVLKNIRELLTIQKERKQEGKSQRKEGGDKGSSMLSTLQKHVQSIAGLTRRITGGQVVEAAFSAANMLPGKGKGTKSPKGGGLGLGPGATRAALFAGGIAALGAAAVASTVAISKFGDKLLEGASRLAQYNGQIAASFARANYREIQRSMRSGSIRAGSTVRLQDAMQNLKDELQPIKDVIMVGITNIVTWLVNIVSTIIKGVKGIEFIANLVEQILKLMPGWFGNGANANLPWEQMLLDLQAANIKATREPLFNFSNDDAKAVGGRRKP